MERKSFSQKRTEEILNAALDYIAEAISRHEHYSVLSQALGMSDEEIKQAGFDCTRGDGG